VEIAWLVLFCFACVSALRLGGRFVICCVMGFVMSVMVIGVL